VSANYNLSLAPLHLVLLTSSFPYGEREEFLEDEIPILAGQFSKVTIVAEEGEVARPIPDNCAVVRLLQPPPPRWRLLPQACTSLVEDWTQGRGLLARVYMLRTILYYLRHSTPVVEATERHLRSRRDALPLCFYSYWFDYKALAATRLRQLHPGSPAASRAHGWDVYAERHPYGYLPLRRYIASRLTAIYPVSDSGARELARQLQGAGNITTCRLGVRAITDAPPPSRSTSSADRLLILSVASLIPLKRIGLLIEALAQAPPDCGFSWLHFGDGPEQAHLQEKAARLRIPYTLAGRIAHADLRQALLREAANAVLVNTSASEGIPVSMMEAMACGIPCIGTNVGGVGEIIEDGVNGFLLPPEPTPKNVGAALERYARMSGSEQGRMRMAAFDTWRNRFNASRNYSDFATRLAGLTPGP
jgi:glycosyltransferase involved in cell wall biosynthesis